MAGQHFLTSSPPALPALRRRAVRSGCFPRHTEPAIEPFSSTLHTVSAAKMSHRATHTLSPLHSVLKILYGWPIRTPVCEHVCQCRDWRLSLRSPLQSTPHCTWPRGSERQHLARGSAVQVWSSLMQPAKLYPLGCRQVNRPFSLSDLEQKQLTARS